MRIRIDHSTRYAYARPARFIVQMLRLTPRSCESQQVREWRIETDVDARLRRSDDAFGNIVHSLYTERPTDALTIRVTGEVSTLDTGGVIRGQNERLQPTVYLRDTRLTQADPGMVEFAQAAVGTGAGSSLDRMHRLMGAIHGDVAFEVGATSATHTAAEAFAIRRGVCQDHAQIFITCARTLGVPARYVSGHLNRSDGQHDQDAAHAWAEAWIEGLGWVGFDAANGICPTDNYVRIATGLDALGATPIRGTSYGGGIGTLTVALHVRPVQQSQQQHQSKGWS
ncbi:MAG: transglutaminase N-terminal domain-containing protein [Brevundimonas sp.]